MWKNQIASLFLGAVLSAALGMTGCASSNPSYGPDAPRDAGVVEDLSMLPVPDLTITMCQLRPQGGCPAGFKCTTHDAVTTLCDPDGTNNLGERCTQRESVDSCYAGGVCTLAAPMIGLCRAFCRTDSDCGTKSYCELPLGSMGIRVCTLPCNPFGTTAGCPSATSCYAYGREHTDCRSVGTVATGQPCLRPEECQPGNSCIGASGACRKLCRRGINTDCPNLQRCYDIINDDNTSWPTYGFCL